MGVNTTPEKPRCQSCGMPVQAGHFGTEADGRETADWCKFCYQQGAFTLPDLTLEGMIQRSVDFMTGHLGYFLAPEAWRRHSLFLPMLVAGARLGM